MELVHYDLTGNYIAIFGILGVLRVLTGVVVWLAKPPKGSAADLQQQKVR